MISSPAREGTTKHFILAALAGMLTIAVTGGLLYGVVFASFFRANIVDLGVMRQPPAFGWIALSLRLLTTSWSCRISRRDAPPRARSVPAGWAVPAVPMP